LKEIELAIKELEKLEFSCVVFKNDELFCENGIGVKPIISWLDSDKDFFNGAFVADKIIGKAAALLLVLGKAKMVYGLVMSETAIEVFEKNNIPYSFGEKVPFIENRTATGMCPLEQSVVEIFQPSDGYVAIKSTIKELMKNKI